MNNSIRNIFCQVDIKKEPSISRSKTLKFYVMVNEKYLLAIPLSSEKLNRSKTCENTTVFLCANKYKLLHLLKLNIALKKNTFRQPKIISKKITLYSLISLYEITLRNILFLRYTQSHCLYRVISNNKYKDINCIFFL